MATLFSTPAARQPFAPIDGSRLQNLTSLKNRQNALPTSLASPAKRKAVVYEEDAENIDPIIFTSPKRSKGKDGTETFKPSTAHFILSKAAPIKNLNVPCSPMKSTISRTILQPRSPAPKLSTSVSSTLSAPAGRSPTRKRVGILNRRRTASSFTRVDPPKFTVPTASDAPFSIADALSGTIPSYRSRQISSVPRTDVVEPQRKSGWFFDIYEDTLEETMTNLMEHSTCTLDISSDEETEARQRDERGKENVPPLDDVSQTRMPSTSSSTSISYDSITTDTKAQARNSRFLMRRRKEIEEGAIEIDRRPLGDLEAEEFYADGCTKADVVLVADEEADETQSGSAESAQSDEAHDSLVPQEEEGPSLCLPSIPPSTFDISSVDALMAKSSDSEAAAQAKLLEPLEKAEEGFEVWESGSAKAEEEEEAETVL